jgi:hypothetical protein
MRIASKFKDFYDYAFPYRDTDLRSFYWERHTRQESLELKTLSKDFSVDNRTPYHGQNYSGLPEFRTSNGSRRDPGYEEEFVVVADEVVSVWRDKDAELDGLPLYSTLPTFKHKKWHSWRQNDDVTTYPVVMKNTFSKFKELQETYRTPILHFCIFGSYLQITINPKLMDYGVQHAISPEQAYQEIEMWFANQKYDREEPIPMTDKQKILTHGLDPKTSFRHPIK